MNGMSSKFAVSEQDITFLILVVPTGNWALAALNATLAKFDFESDSAEYKPAAKSFTNAQRN